MPAETMRKVVDGVTQGGDLGYKGAEGRSLFRPTDIEVGPDGALYIAGWGSVYGTEYVPAEKWTAEENAKYQGRVFRLRHKENAPSTEKNGHGQAQKHYEWTFDELIEAIGHQLQVWRVNAQVRSAAVLPCASRSSTQLIPAPPRRRPRGASGRLATSTAAAATVGPSPTTPWPTARLT